MVSTQDRSREILKDKFLKELGIENPTEEMRRKLNSFDANTLMKPIIERMLQEGKTSGQIINYLGQTDNRGTMLVRIQRVKTNL